MGKKSSLSNSERQEITQLLAEGKSARDIGRVLQRDARTIKKQLKTSVLKEKLGKTWVNQCFLNEIFAK